MTLPYDTIFSRYMGIVNDPKELSLNEADLFEIYNERLHMVLGDPRVNAKFLNIELDDEVQRITFTLKNSVNDISDSEFVVKLFAMGMGIEWMKPQVDSLDFALRMVGGKEEKSLQNSYKQMQDRLKRLEKQFSDHLSSHGYLNNSYLKGNS